MLRRVLVAVELLGELLLDGDRQVHLADLAAGVSDGRVDHLLRRRRRVGRRPGARTAWSASRRPAGVAALAVLDERAGDAPEVDAVVLVEAGVLGGDDRLQHDRRDLVDRDVAAVLVVERRDQRLAVGGVDVGDLRRRAGPAGPTGRLSKSSAPALAARPVIATAGKAAAATTRPARRPQITSAAAFESEAVVTLAHPVHRPNVRDETIEPTSCASAASLSLDALGGRRERSSVASARWAICYRVSGLANFADNVA